MPKRTNPFQGLVKLIEEQLWEDAEITESAELENAGEVDILIEFRKSGIDFRVTVECRDHKRPQGKDWIRHIRGKYENEHVDKIFAVASNGFWDSAEEAASDSDLDISILTLADAKEVNWEGLSVVLNDITFETYKIKLLEEASLSFEPTNVPKNIFAETANHPSKLKIIGAGNSYEHDDNIFNEIELPSNDYLRDSVLDTLNEDNRRQLRDNESINLDLQMSPKEEIRLEDPRGVRYSVNKLILTVHISIESKTSKIAKLFYRNSKVAASFEEVGGQDFSLAIVNNKDKSPTLCLRFNDSKINAPPPPVESGSLIFSTYSFINM